MKISGIAGTVMLGFSAILKIMHLPGAGHLLTLGALLLSFLFMPSALMVLWKETHSGKRLFLFISAFLAGAAYIMGSLFKIQHWPGSGLMISIFLITGILFFIPSLLLNKIREKENSSKVPVYITGAIALAIYLAGFGFKMMHWPLAGLLMTLSSLILVLIVFPWYIWSTWKDEEHISARFIFMVVATLTFIIPAALISFSVERSYEEPFFIQQEQQEALVEYRQNNNKALLDLYSDSLPYPAMEDLHVRTGRLIDIINGVEASMVQIAEGASGKPSDKPVKSENRQKNGYRFLSQPFHQAPAKSVLLPGSNSRKELDTALTDYRDYLSSITGESRIGNYGPLLETETYLADRDLALLPALHALYLLKNGVLITESAALRTITNR